MHWTPLIYSKAPLSNIFFEKTIRKKYWRGAGGEVFFRLISACLLFLLILQTTGPVSAAATAPSVGDPPVRVIESTARGLVLELTLPEYRLEPAVSDLGPCVRVAVPGWGTTGGPGEPALPMKGILLGIPAAGTAQVTGVTAGQQETLEQVKVCPTPTPIMEPLPSGEVRDAGEQLIASPAAYSANRRTPGQWAAAGETAFVRSQRVQQVHLQPFQYNPVRQTLTVAKKLRVQVAFPAPLASAAAPAVDEGPFEPALQDALINHETARDFRDRAWRSPSAHAQTAASFLPPGQPAYKLAVAQDGLVRVTYEALSAAGLPLAEIDPQTFQLSSLGQDVALALVDEDANGSFESGDSMVFYGQKNRTRFTDTHIYWLTWGEENGMRMAISDGAPSGGTVPASYRAVARQEENKVYSQIAAASADGDRWFWELIYATSSTSKTYTMALPGAAGSSVEPARLRGSLVGYTAKPAHFTRISINDYPVIASSWDAQGELAFDVEVPQSILLEGNNTIKVEVPLTDGTNPITLDSFYVNWFEVEYAKAYQAGGGRAAFAGDGAGDFNFQVPGFAAAESLLFDVTDPLRPIQIRGASFLADPSGGTYTLSFQQTISGRREYAAAPPEGMFAPASITADQLAGLSDPANRADYLIISHPDFIPAIQPLADDRATEGSDVMVVDVLEVYDEFSAGVFDPEAIRDFIAYAYAHWAAAPAYVLLVGDGNYDFKNYLGKNEPNYIPPYLVNADPWVGEIAADNRYVTVSGADLLPDLAVGRLPVQTPAEAAAVVDKILAYKDAAQGSWAEKTLFAAGKNDPDSGNFPALSDGLVGRYFLDSSDVDKIYYGTTHPDPAAARSAVTAAINDGRGIIHFSGHSTPLGWYGDAANPNNTSMLHANSILSLSNAGKLPILLSMTCLVGNYNNPYARSLDEALLVTASKGSVASFSPVGKGLTLGHDALDRGFFDAIINKKITDLGSATILAKLYLFTETIGYMDLLDTYSLLGDPALRYPNDPVEVEILDFKAEKGTGGIALRWETISELTTAGFELYRREISGGAFEKISPARVKAVSSGQPQGNTYTYLDSGAEPGAAYEYRLDVIENSQQVSTTLFATYLERLYWLPFIRR